MYPKGKQSTNLLEKGYWFYIAIKLWSLCHHCDFKTPSRSALIGVTTICQQWFFSFHLLKKTVWAEKCFSWVFEVICICILLNTHLKQDEKLFKSKSGEVCDNLHSIGKSFVSQWLTYQIVVQLLSAQHESCRCNSSPINFHILNLRLAIVRMCRSSNCKCSYLGKSDPEWVIWALSSLSTLKSAGHNLSRLLHF